MTPIDWAFYDAVLFDLDGVLTPTAELHRQAWTEMFDAFLAEHAPGQRPFGPDDYLGYVDGRPRFDGVRAFLAGRGITLPEGSPGDPPGDGSVGALGNRKDEAFNELLQRRGITAYPGSVALLDVLAALGTKTAVVSSSRNAPVVLAAAGLTSRFAVLVDGAAAEERGLAGKPAPDMFLAAATELAVAPPRAVVVEDALSGVAAGRAGGFGLVVGVDRGAGADGLRAAGADVVVDDLALTIGTDG